MFIGVIRRPKDGTALGLFRYRDDNGWKTVLWVGLNVLNTEATVVLYEVQWKFMG